MIAFAGLAGATPDEDEDALFRNWFSAFAEMKRGDIHVEGQHWPRAIWKYRSSLKEFEALAADYPNYESELVAYRVADLQQRIESAQQTLRSQFADTAERFDRVFEKIQRSRQLEEAGLFSEAYRDSMRAAHELKSLAIKDPDFYSDMLSEELFDIEELAGRVKTHLLTLADGKKVVSALELELSRELPELEEASLPDRPDIMISAALFPAANS